MKIIKPADTSPQATAAAETRLVAAMYNMEHAAIVCDDKLAPLPAPHKLWPTVAVPPVTELGLPSTVHYKPSLAVVYHELGEAEVVRFVARVSAAVDALGDAHLRGHRAAMATPAVVIRHTGRAIGGSIKAEVAEPFRLRLVESELPSRMYLWVNPAAPPSYTTPPPHFSARAVFTWVFLPVARALDIRQFVCLDAVNAMVASVLFDSVGMCRHPDAAEIFKLTMEDFVHSQIGALPKTLDFTRVAESQSAGTRRRPGNTAALLVKRDGSIELVGHYLNLRRPAAAHSRAALPALKWNPRQIATPGAKTNLPGHQCCSCAVPVSGPAVVFAGAKIPVRAEGVHREPYAYYRMPGESGDEILPETKHPASKRFLLCLRCWNHLDSPRCLTGHLGAKAWAVTVPLTQAEACANSPGFEGLAPLLAGTAADIPGVAGAFVVSAAGAKFIVAGANLGAYPGLSETALARLKLPIVANLCIAKMN
jgi:hypothetical protein